MAHERQRPAERRLVALALALAALLCVALWLARRTRAVAPSALADAPSAAHASQRDDAALARAGKAQRQPDAPRVPAGADATSEPPAELEDATFGARVEGFVTDRAGAGLAGARVLASLRRGGGELRLGGATCDAHGHYRIAASALEELSPLELELVRVRIAAEADGHQPAEQSFDLPEPALPLAELPDVVLFQGGVLRGRLFDAERAPAAGVLVRLAHGAPPELGFAASAVSDESGAFALGIPARGTFALLARDPERGAVYLGGLELDPARDALAPELVLAGSIALAGVLLDHAGAPLAGVDLVALDEQTLAARHPQAAARAQQVAEVAGGGLAFGSTTSDREGRFRFAGLRPARYVVRLAGAPEDRQPAPAPAQQGESIAVVAPGHFLRVRVRDALGRPVAGALVTLVAGDSAQSCSAAAPDAEAVLRATPDAEHRVQASAGHHAATQQRWHCDPGVAQSELVLVLAPPADLGHLRLVVRDEAGAPVERVRASLWPQPGEGAQQPLLALSTDATGLLPPIPAGRYRVELAAGGRDELAAIYLPVAASPDVRVRAGETVELELVARRGGRLRVTVVRADAQDGAPPPTATVGAAAETWLPARPLRFARVGDDRRDAFELPLGAAATTRTVLAPGSYFVAAQARGWSSPAVLVLVDAGGTSDVVLTLVRER